MSETFLDKIIIATRALVEGSKASVGLSFLRLKAERERDMRPAHNFRSALVQKRRRNIVAEIKRASPSKGVINDTIDVAETAVMYRDGGACAISVLTEEEFFKGSLDDVRTVRRAVDLPILRKDFIIDEYQVLEAAEAGADACLLIVAALSPTDLKKLLTLTEDELEMDALVEVHTLDELQAAANCGARLIGVNNRDLRTFEVSLDVSRSLIRHRPPDAQMIAESGISSREEIDELRSLGFDGFLVGESLMRSREPGSLLGELTLEPYDSR